MDFAKCEQCGKIFKREDCETECPACRNEPILQTTDKDLLRTVRNYIKDAMANGELVTVTQVTEKTGVPESKIWHFIAVGEIDTSSFRDPEVQRFIQKQRLERMRKLSGEDDVKEGEHLVPEKRKGFYTRDDHARRR